jgi:hypothetical protein
MPRPQNGYFNAAGQPIPGTHDPIQRFMDQTALKFWAYKRGQQGLPLFDRAAIDIGSTVHGMAELDLRGRPDREIEAYANNCLVAPDHLRKAWTSFSAFRAWRQRCEVRAIAQEVPLVSERYQYGGTPDTVAMIGGGLGLLDFKTSPKPYPEHLIGLAAHGQLWQERHPQHPLTSYHLIILPKDGGAFQHFAYQDLGLHWKLFQLYLEAYRLDQSCGSAVAMADAVASGPTTTASPASSEAPAAVKPSKPRVRASAKTVHAAAPATMAEMLRAYGHLKEAEAC